MFPSVWTCKDKYEKNCSFSFLGWRILSFFAVWNPHPSFLFGDVFVSLRCCQMLLPCGSECLQWLKVSLLRCIFWHPHLWSGFICFGSLSALSHHFCSIYRKAECRFVQFRSPSAASVSSHVVKTMSSPCSAHVVWLSSQFQNVLFHPSDTSGFIWRNLNSEPLWIFVSDVSWRCIVWSSWSHFCSWWLSEEPFHLWLWQWCFSRIMIYLHLLKGCSSSK